MIDKPAGLVVHPAPGHADGTLVNALLSRGISGGHGRRPGIVHRLDRDTSGLMVVARTEAAYQHLVADMAARNIERTYAALVVGSLPQDEGTIDAPIGRHLRDRKRMSLHTASPRRAVTHFVVVAPLRGLHPRSTFAWRPAAPTRSGCTSRLSATRWPAMRCTVAGRDRPALSASSCTPAGWPCRIRSERERRLVFDSPLPPDLAAFLAHLHLQTVVDRTQTHRRPVRRRRNRADESPH